MAAHRGCFDYELDLLSDARTKSCDLRPDRLQEGNHSEVTPSKGRIGQNTQNWMVHNRRKGTLVGKIDPDRRLRRNSCSELKRLRSRHIVAGSDRTLLLAESVYLINMSS